MGPNNDPVDHIIDRENYTMTNIALEGHPYEGGQVEHSLTLDTSLSFSRVRGFYMREGIYLYTLGTGPNKSLCCDLTSAVINNAAGLYLFRDTHIQAPRLMRQYLESP